jgi:hypothetical protein
MRASGTVPPGASISLQKYVNVARSCANSSTVRPSATMVERCGAVDVLEQQQQVDVGRAWAARGERAPMMAATAVGYCRCTSRAAMARMVS